MNDFNHTTKQHSQAFVLPRPYFQQLDALFFVGLREPMNENSDKEIPLLWQNFMSFAATIPHRTDKNHYGLCVQPDNHSQEFYYMTSCTVSDFSRLPANLSPIIIPSQRYAVFSHNLHISRIRETISAIFDDWLPNSSYEIAQKSTHSLHFFEKYTEEFDPVSGMGGTEIWLPIVEKS